MTVVRYPGFGGLLSFDVADAVAARRVETSTRLIVNMTSLGGVSTRIEARARWEGERVPPGLLRLSVGLEDADALWEDLERALGQAMSFLDRIRYHRPPKTPEEADKLALRQLEARGADLSLPRHVIHFLLFEREGDARAAAGVVDGNSWSTRVDPPTATVAEWSVRIDGHRVVGPDTVAAFRAQFEQAAAAHGGEYDGWEAAATP